MTSQNSKVAPFPVCWRCIDRVRRRGGRAGEVAEGIDPKMVFVQHPIQDRTDAELRVLAEDAVAHIVEAITARR